MIEFIDNNGKHRRVTEFTMDEWNGEQWVIVEDYWGGFTDEEFLEYLAGYPEPSVHNGYEYDVSGGPWPTSIERRSYFYNGGC